MDPAKAQEKDNQHNKEHDDERALPPGLGPIEDREDEQGRNGEQNQPVLKVYMALRHAATTTRKRCVQDAPPRRKSPCSTRPYCTGADPDVNAVALSQLT